MKKTMKLLLISLMTLSMVACKKGTVSGQVLDPFSGKPVQNATVWIKGTPFHAKTADGTFKFEKVKVGEYTLNAGKNKYSEAVVAFSVTESSLDINQNIYIFSKEDLDPGMYKTGSTEKPEKISNLWLNWEATCKESLFGYRLKFVDTKTKKDMELPAPTKTSTQLSVLYYQASSANAELTAKAFAMETAKTSEHADCKGFEAKETQGLFPVKAKSVDLTATYKSDNLFEITGTLPKGKQAVAIMQGEKVVKAYYFVVE